MLKRSQASASHVSKDAAAHPLRKFELMEEYRVLREKDMAAFAKMMQEPGAEVPRDCPACGSKECATLFEKDGFDFARCNYCQCIYLMPVPKAELLNWYYDKSSAIAFFNEKILRPSLPQRQQIFADRVAKLKPYLPEKASVLEVGASVGLFVEAAKNAGYRVSGVEPNTELAKTTSAAFDVPIANCFIEDYTASEPFDAVVIWEVIEHITVPAEVLKKINSLLKPGGVVAMTLPNLAGIEFALCGPDHEMIEAPSHINYFTPETITLLLERCGFKVEVLTTPGILDYANVLNHIRRQSSESEKMKLWPEAETPPSDIGNAFLLWLHTHMSEEERKQMEELATRAIQRSHMSGNMFVVARRA